MSTDQLLELSRCVSGEVGLVHRLDEGLVPYDHPRLATCFAYACDTSDLFGAHAGSTAGGIAPDVRTARLAAMGESLERYSAVHVPTSRLWHGSRRELPDDRVVVEPDWLCRPAEAAAVAVSWVPGTRLAPDGPGTGAWIAASRVYLQPDDDRGPPIGRATSTGLAFHTDPWQALASGLLEVIERDAFMITWLTRAPVRVLETDQRWRTEEGIEVRFDRASEEYRTYRLDSPTGVPVVLAVAVGGHGQPPVAVGAAAHPDLVRATRKALIEARQTFDWCRVMMTHGHEIPSRDQLDEFEDHVAYYLDPGRLTAFDFLADRREPLRLTLSRTADRAEPAERVRSLVRAAGAARLDCFAADVTSPDVRELGGWAVRALIPGLYPLTVGAESRSGHPRIRGVGLVNPDPHPFP